MTSSKSHIAIIDRHAARMLAGGAKRIESRFMRSRRAPFGRVARGDRVYFKLSGGGLIGSARVTRVREFADLAPAGVRALRVRYGAAVAARASYWSQRLRARYAVLMWLDDWRPSWFQPQPSRLTTRFPSQPRSRPSRADTSPALVRQYGCAWLVV